jgi:predicted PhzF superfamily epimerase YddE/YHI9
MNYYIVDSFTDRPFHGNPAGVCLLDSWLADGLMQNIAAENNLAETAFLVYREQTNGKAAYDLRWFSPQLEIDLCGHATLASAFILMEILKHVSGDVIFHTASGPLGVRRDGAVYFMDFPRRIPVACPVPAGLAEALGVQILETAQARDLLVRVSDEAAVLAAKPDFVLLKKFSDIFAFAVTAPGKTADFVSRFFAPNAGIDEDPVTGSSHSSLIPYWSARLSKNQLLARQLSPRGGTLYCRDMGDRVEIGGTARLYLAGEIQTAGY